MLSSYRALMRFIPLLLSLLSNARDFIREFLGLPADPAKPLLDKTDSLYETALTVAKAPATLLPNQILGTPKPNETVIYVSGHFIPISQVQGQFISSGGAGSGKTRTLEITVGNILQSAPANDLIIIVDAKGDFLSIVKASLPIFPRRLFLLDLASTESDAWDISKDMDGSYLRLAEFVDQFTPSPEEAKDPFYPMAVQLFLTAYGNSILKMFGVNWNFADFYRGIQLTIEEIEKVIAQNPELNQMFLDLFWAPLDQKTMGNILASATMNLKKLQLLAGNDYYAQKKFSLKDLSENGGVLYIAPTREVQSVENPMIQMVLNWFTNIRTSVADHDVKNKCWMFIDEAPALGRIKSLPYLMSFARSKGVSVFLSIQQVSQLKDRYKPGEVSEILGNANHVTWFRNNDLDTEEWLRDYFGEETYWSSSRTESISRDGFSTNASEQEHVRSRIPKGALSDLPAPDNNVGIWCFRHFPFYDRKYPTPFLIPAHELKSLEPPKDFSFTRQSKPPSRTYPPRFTPEEMERFLAGGLPSNLEKLSIENPDVSELLEKIISNCPYEAGSVEELIYRSWFVPVIGEMLKFSTDWRHG
jgi:hypothetical protein